MKRLARSTVLAMIALLIIVMPVLAGPPTLSIDTIECEQVSITATHSSQTSNMVKIRVDGVEVAAKTGWLTVSLTYTGSEIPGNHTAVARYFERRWSQQGQEFYWKLMHTITRVFRIDACEYDAYLSLDNSCAGLDIDVIVTRSGIPIYTDDFHFHPWIDPYTLESYGPYGILYSLPYEQSTVMHLGETFEPGNCLVVLEHDFEIIGEADCDGWSFTASASEGGSATPRGSATGTWSDPYTLESVLVLYDFVWPDGVAFTSFGSVSEPEECLEVLEHNFEIHQRVDCLGWGFGTSSSDGGVGVPQGPKTGAWLDLYILESASITYDVTWPDGYEAVLSDTIYEPEICLNVIDPSYGASIHYDGCEGYCAVVTPNQEGATVSYLVKPCGEWVDPHKTEEVTISFVIYQPDGSQETHEITALEPTSCWKDPCPKRVKMWLLRGTHPNASGILECYIVSQTHPSVFCYQQLCWPNQYPDFVASWAVSGWVDACDVWELDDIRMYWRKPLKDLLGYWDD